MFRMINPVQAYAWGSATAFSELFGWPETGEPQAEVWMGAHPTAPSQLVTDAAEPVHLDAHLGQHPEDLGTLRSDKTLPFLLKVLAVAVPLSIQAHPTKEQAAAGYAAEEAAGVDLTDERRNYVDSNHKPELLVALTEFSALSGFRGPEQTLQDLRALQRIIAAAVPSGSDEMITAVQVLISAVGERDFGVALEAALRGHRGALSAAAGFLASIDPHTADAELSPVSADTVERITAAFPTDPGLFVALMLNRTDLSPGQALFLPAGTLHAYLGGVGVEAMATSDNVLRGGLTTKHIDVAELLRTAHTEELSATLLQPEPTAAHRQTYRPDAEEILLHRIEFPAPGLMHRICEPAPVVALCTRGALTAGDHSLTAGDSVFVPAREPVEFSGAEAQLFLATAQEPQKPMVAG